MQIPICVALYMQLPCRHVVLYKQIAYMQSVVIIRCFIYAKCPYWLLFYTENVHIICKVGRASTDRYCEHSAHGDE